MKITDVQKAETGTGTAGNFSDNDFDFTEEGFSGINHPVIKPELLVKVSTHKTIHIPVYEFYILMGRVM